MAYSHDITTVLPQCPHCLDKYTTFYFVEQQHRHVSKVVSFWVCGKCLGGVVCERTSEICCSVEKEIDFSTFTDVWPEIKKPSVPKHTPHRQAGSYLAAVRILNSFPNEMPSADAELCCLSIRKAVETTANEFEAKGGNLYQKIEDLAQRHILTESMKDWAQEIRLIGNDAAHEEDCVTRQDAEQSIFFAEMLFMFLYTLPSMVKERRLRKDAEKKQA